MSRTLNPVAGDRPPLKLIQTREYVGPIVYHYPPRVTDSFTYVYFVGCNPELTEMTSREKRGKNAFEVANVTIGSQ